MKNNGFTLVELSIVLVIIGLLIGGVLVGQSLITSAKINAQVRQIQQFDIASNNYIQKFNQIPGDSIIFCCPRAGTGLGSNNNGILDRAWSNAYVTEAYHYFIDLSMAGMLKASYRGSSNRAVTGEQHPKADIGRGGIIVIGKTTGEIYYFLGASRDATTLGSDQNYAYLSNTGILSSAEALSLDSKTDDGSPTTGEVASTTSTVQADGAAGYPFTSGTDSSTSCVHNGIYNTSQSATDLCRLVIQTNLY